MLLVPAFAISPRDSAIPELVLSGTPACKVVGPWLVPATAVRSWTTKDPMNIVDAPWRVLPLSVVMVTGPQIITAMILATRQDRVPQTARFTAGAALGITAIVGFTYVTGFTVSGTFELPTLASWALTVVLVGVMISSFAKRNAGERQSHDGSGRSGAFIAGALLLSIFPTDLLTNIGVGTTLSQLDQPLWPFVLFVTTTVGLLLIPIAIVGIMADRAEEVLTRLRTGITRFSWILNELICVLILIAIW